MYVFVYGSLKKGFFNHQVIENPKFICKTHTKECYKMLDLQSFPGVTKEEKLSVIHGEVYNVDNITLELLDKFEGNWYLREAVELDAGFSAQMYFLKLLPENLNYHQTVDTGIWTEK